MAGGGKIMEVPNRLVYNFLLEIKRKEIHPVERAEMINQYLKEENLSARALAADLGIPHSTLQDWLDYSRMKTKDYDDLVKNGVSKKVIHRMLRGHRNGSITLNAENILNLKLQEALSEFRDYINKPVWTNDTLILLKELKNVLARIEIHIEQNMKTNGGKKI